MGRRHDFTRRTNLKDLGISDGAVVFGQEMRWFSNCDITVKIRLHDQSRFQKLGGTQFTQPLWYSQDV